jgi:hypothetical protein
VRTLPCDVARQKRCHACRGLAGRVARQHASFP